MTILILAVAVMAAGGVVAAVGLGRRHRGAASAGAGLIIGGLVLALFA